MTKLLFILLLLFGCFDEYSPIEQGDIYGCTDDTACNYNPNANNDDGNCYYAEDCDSELFSGVTETDTNGNLIGEVDSDDWCQFEFNMDATNTAFGLNPVYPNPVTLANWGPFGDSYQICYQYSSPFDTTWSNFNQINIDIVSSGNDTIYSFNDDYANGQIGICAYIPDSLVVDSIYRMHMTSDDFNCYGDIQFEQ